MSAQEKSKTHIFKISQTIAVQHDDFYYPFNACDAIGNPSRFGSIVFLSTLANTCDGGGNGESYFGE